MVKKAKEKTPEQLWDAAFERTAKSTRVFGTEFDVMYQDEYDQTTAEQAYIALTRDRLRDEGNIVPDFELRLQYQDGFTRMMRDLEARTR